MHLYCQYDLVSTSALNEVFISSLYQISVKSWAMYLSCLIFSGKFFGPELSDFTRPKIFCQRWKLYYNSVCKNRTSISHR